MQPDNVGGVRARADALLELVKTVDPDVVAMQECNRLMNPAAAEAAGWHAHIDYGVCILSRHRIGRVDARDPRDMWARNGSAAGDRPLSGIGDARAGGAPPEPPPRDGARRDRRGDGRQKWKGVPQARPTCSSARSSRGSLASGRRGRRPRFASWSVISTCRWRARSTATTGRRSPTPSRRRASGSGARRRRTGTGFRSTTCSSGEGGSVGAPGSGQRLGGDHRPIIAGIFNWVGG